MIILHFLVLPVATSIFSWFPLSFLCLSFLCLSGIHFPRAMPITIQNVIQTYEVTLFLAGRWIWLSNYLLTFSWYLLAPRHNKVCISVSAHPQFRPVLKIQKNLKWSVHSIEIPTLVGTLKTQRLYKMNSKLWMTAPVEPLLNCSSDDCIALDLDKRLHTRQMVGGHQTRLCPCSDRSNPIVEAVDFPKATYYFFLSNLY